MQLIGLNELSDKGHSYDHDQQPVIMIRLANPPSSFNFGGIKISFFSVGFILSFNFNFLQCSWNVGAVTWSGY